MYGRMRMCGPIQAKWTSFNSPEGALEDSPGRKPGVSGGRRLAKPRRGDGTTPLSPLRGSLSRVRPVTQGLRPGLSSFVPPGLRKPARNWSTALGATRHINNNGLCCRRPAWDGTLAGIKTIALRGLGRIP